MSALDGGPRKDGHGDRGAPPRQPPAPPPHRGRGIPDPLSALFGIVVPRAVDSIDLNDVLDHVDLDRLIARVDLQAVIDRLDVDGLIDRVSVEALIDRVDVDAVIERVDLDAVLARIDIAGIVKRAEVDAIVTATAAGLGRRALDVVRRQLAGIDILTTRAVARLLRRPRELPPTDRSCTGLIAAGATRLAAFFVDLAVMTVTFVAGLAVGLFMVSLFVAHRVGTNHGARWYLLGYGVFALVYQWVCLVLAGRTPGKAFAGLRVTAPDGGPVRAGVATKRVLVYPFSFVLGLGLIGIVLGARHRALHDVAAPTLVRYDWGDRPAQVPAPLTEYLAARGVLRHPAIPPVTEVVTATVTGHATVTGTAPAMGTVTGHAAASGNGPSNVPPAA